MLYYFDVNWINEIFNRNLVEWCAGGPSQWGYTREGDTIFIDKNYKAVSYERGMLDVEEVLAKNRKETERWHISFLKGGKIDHKSAYCVEYLAPRYDSEEIEERMSSLLSLFRSIFRCGYNYRHPVFVADVASLGIGFRYFRFDGCHRTSCAKVLGIKKIPVYIFKLEEDLRTV